MMTVVTPKVPSKLLTARRFAVRTKTRNNHDATRDFLNEDFNYRNRKAKNMRNLKGYIWQKEFCSMS